MQACVKQQNEIAVSNRDTVNGQESFQNINELLFYPLLGSYDDDDDDDNKDDA